MTDFEWGRVYSEEELGLGTTGGGASIWLHAYTVYGIVYASLHPKYLHSWQYIILAYIVTIIPSPRHSSLSIRLPVLLLEGSAVLCFREGENTFKDLTNVWNCDRKRMWRQALDDSFLCCMFDRLVVLFYYYTITLQYYRYVISSKNKRCFLIIN